jgi:NADH-quinone oxidoreductase subunit J
MGNPILFIILAIVAVAAALAMVLSRNAVHSALFLVLNFTTIAMLYIILNAPFIAMVQITVYAGAIMVLFLFVIMLLGAERLAGVGGREAAGAGGIGWQFSLAVLLALVVLASFLYLLIQGDATAASTATTIDSSPTNLGLRLFESYVFPFELTGILLLVAMIGVVVLGGVRKRGRDA